VARSTRGERTIPASAFFEGFMTTALEPDELLTEVRLPPDPGRCSIQEVTRRHGDFALVGVVAIVRSDGGTIADARQALLGAAPTVVRATRAEALLQGAPATDSTFAATAEAAAAGLEDAHYDGSGNFRAGTFMDYLLPGSLEVPSIEIAHLDSDLYEVDYRGVGEGGTIGPLPAVLNAVAHALGGAPVTELPLTPGRVLDWWTPAVGRRLRPQRAQPTTIAAPPGRVRTRGPGWCARPARRLCQSRGIW
jgi:hypothetical protein